MDILDTKFFYPFLFLQGIDWTTDAFDDQHSYWMQMLMMISSPHRLLPLDQRLTAVNKTVCFQEAYFGVSINFIENLILKLSFCKDRLNLQMFVILYVT